MSLELIDLRAKVTELTDCWLDAKQAETGLDRSELVRQILDDHASSEVSKAILIVDKMNRKGCLRDSHGVAGNKP